MAWDATHITAAALSLIALAVLERGPGHSGARHPRPRSFPAPLMSQRLFGQTPSWNFRLRVFCSLYLARSQAQQLGKFGVSLIPVVSDFQPPRRLRQLRLILSFLKAHPHILLHR